MEKRRKLIAGSMRDLSGWPRVTGSHIGKGKEEDGVRVVMMKARTSKKISVLCPSIWRHGRIGRRQGVGA